MNETLPNPEAAKALFDVLNTALVQYCEITGDNNDDPVVDMLKETLVRLGMLLHPDFVG